MELKNLEVEMAIRFENQKYKGTVRYDQDWTEDVQVKFEGYNEPGHIDPTFLRPF